MKARHAFFALATLSIFGGVVFADTTLFYVEVKSGGAKPVYVEETVAETSPAVEQEELTLAWEVRALPNVDVDLYWEGVLLDTFTANAEGLATFETEHALGLYVVQFVDPEGALLQGVQEISSQEQTEASVVMRPSLYADADEENLYFYGFFLPLASVEFHLIGTKMEAVNNSVSDADGLYAFAVPISTFSYGDYQVFVEGFYGEENYISEAIVFEYIPEPQDPGYVEYMEERGLEPEPIPQPEEALVEEEAEEKIKEDKVPAPLQEEKSPLQSAIDWLLGKEPEVQRVEEGVIQSVAQPGILPSKERAEEGKIKQALSYACPNLAFVDKNRDCRVNQLDVFILRETSEVALPNDISGDGEMTLKDYSILAYYWTY